MAVFQFIPRIEQVSEFRYLGYHISDHRRDKVTKMWSWPLTFVEVRNSWIFTSTAPYIFMAWWLSTGTTSPFWSGNSFTVIHKMWNECTWSKPAHMFWSIPNLRYMISRMCLILFIGNWFSYRWEQFHRRNRACSKDDNSSAENKWTYSQEEYCIHGYSCPVWQW